MSDSLSDSVALVESGTATNPNTPYPDELDLEISRSDDTKSVSAAANAPTLSPNLSTQENYDSDVGNLEHDDNSVLNKETETANAPLSSNLSIQEDYDLDDNNSRSDDSGGAFEQRYYGFQPTWTTDISATRLHAHACWHSQQKISPMKLDIHRAKQKVFFKLYTRIPLNQAPGNQAPGRRNPSRNAYIFIYPERINKLVFKAEPTSENFHSPISLTFSLNRLSALILPKPRFGFTQKAEGAISSLYNLVQQSSFTIYADLSRSRLSRRLLEEMCEEITQHKLSSIVAFTNVTNLYQGSGEEAHVIEGDSLLKSVIHKEDAANLRPPAYEEGDPSVPLTSK
jgi:hypothetical protein